MSKSENSGGGRKASSDTEPTCNFQDHPELRMEGLMVLGAYALYAWLSVWVVKKAAREARARGISGWKWGLPAGLVMYHLLLWDLIPTVIAHRYYCNKDAGFVVHKTLEEWKKENPGIAGTLKSSPDSKAWGGAGHMGYTINERFADESTSTNVFLSVRRNLDWITDTGKSEIMAENIDYSAGSRAWGNSLNDYRTFWKQHCFSPSDGVSAYYKYSGALRSLETVKQETTRE